MEIVINVHPHGTNEAAFLLYQKVKITIALIIIKLMPPNSDIKEYAATFQYKFRRKANRCNLFLEKEIFYNQLLILLPALKIYSFEQNGESYEPMEIDINTDTATFHEPAHILIACSQPSSYQSENYSKFLHKINSMAQFLDAIIATKLLCDKKQNVTQSDVCKILSTFDGAEFSAFNVNESGEYAFISYNLLQYLMRSIDMSRLITECFIFISKLLEKYFKQPTEQIFCSQGLITIHFANSILLKSVENYPHVTECCQVFIKFIHESLNGFFFNVPVSYHTSHCWYVLFGEWKRIKSMCIEILDALIGTLKKFQSDHQTSTEYGTIECILILFRKILSSYLKIHIASKRITNEVMEQSAINEIKTYLQLKMYLKQWEKTLNNLIVHSITENQRVVRLSWQCLKIIISLKCVLVQITRNKNPVTSNKEKLNGTLFPTM